MFIWWCGARMGVPKKREFGSCNPTFAQLEQRRIYNKRDNKSGRGEEQQLRHMAFVLAFV